MGVPVATSVMALAVLPGPQWQPNVSMRTVEVVLVSPRPVSVR